MALLLIAALAVTVFGERDQPVLIASSVLRRLHEHAGPVGLDDLT